MRVIVCGSREWTDRSAIHRTLTGLDDRQPVPLLIVHGACPKGADAFAHEWALAAQRRAPGVTPEPERHPDWSRHGKGAGFLRNEEMAALGADLCLAFWDGKSPGTLDMIKRAVAHGIPVRIVPAKVKA